jgi:hypothetical protein
MKYIYNYKQPAFLLMLIGCLILSGCNKEPIGPTEPDPLPPGSFMTLAAFRALYPGSGDFAVPMGTKKIRGVVISNNANEAAGNYRIQDESGAGIYLYSKVGSPVYALGSILEIDAAATAPSAPNGILTLFNGDLELKDVAINKVTVVPGTLSITPRVATAADLNLNKDAWASTLVKMNDVVITKEGSAGSTGQNFRITDATGSVVSFVRNTSGIVLPEGGAASITGHLSLFNGTPQITIRSIDDVVNGGQVIINPGIVLGTTSPYTINFNNLSAGLPAGVFVVTGATAASAGTTGSLLTTANTNIWNRTGSGFKNFASATGLDMGADSATQVNATNRALGIRQTSGFGDPGGAFVFQVNNTTGKNNLKLEFLLQSLDTASSRLTTWTVDYAFGENPALFTAISSTGTKVTGNKIFSSNLITADLPAAVNNQSQKLWIRIITLSPTTGTGNRASSAIDDVKFLWN